MKSKGVNSPKSFKCDLNSGEATGGGKIQEWNFESLKMSIFSDKYTQIIILLTIIGSVLRLYNLGFNSLWLDEAVTYYYSTLPFKELWETLQNGAEFNPPLFYIVESFMIPFGKDEFIIRLIPALAGIVTIPVFFWLGKEFSDRNCGIVCAALVTFSSFLIYYSQEARAYSLLLLFVALSIVFFLKGMKSGRILHWGLFGIFSGLGFWTHFYSAIIFGILVAWHIFNLCIQREDIWKNSRGIICSFVAFILVTLPLLFVTFELFLLRTSSPPTFGLQGWTVVSHAFSDLSGFHIAAIVLLITLFVIGLLWSFIHEKRKGVFLAFSVIAILIISYYLSYRMPFQTRFLIIMIPFYFLGIAYSSRAFCQIFKNNIVIYTLIACIFLVNVPVLSQYYTVTTKENWRDFSREFEQYTKDGDIVVLLPSYMEQPLNFYYDSARDRTIQLGASNVNDLENLKNEHRGERIFIIMTADIFAVEPSGKSVEWLKENATFIGQYTGIYLFQITE
jgi:4-amino-4-deoxy-L-arabinose transferase-like glycosyltransferase